MSVLAFLLDPLLNRDGMFYLNSARLFMESGVSAIPVEDTWPFLSILIGGISGLTGISLFTIGASISILFGVGWGLSGLCPGPSLASLTWGGTEGLIFLLAMIAGMWAEVPTRAKTLTAA